MSINVNNQQGGKTNLTSTFFPQRRTGRRLTSAGHSDSSGLSSPSEDRRPLNRKPSGYRGTNQSFRENSEFRVGEAVRESSPRGPMKSSTSLPHFSSGEGGSLFFFFLVYVWVLELDFVACMNN